ncbi:hypothetical protein C8N36_1252 [Pelagimonas varians]|nr:hypothetical protein C8N36_1252 [Pelagimonas varians]
MPFTLSGSSQLGMPDWKRTCVNRTDIRPPQQARNDTGFDVNSLEETTFCPILIRLQPRRLGNFSFEHFGDETCSRR